MPQLLGEEYKKLYNTYYDEGISEKRTISAEDSFNHLRHLIGNDHFERVIDVGAGEGSVLELLNKSDFCEQLFALEISSSGVEAIDARGLNRLIDCRQFNGYEIPYPDNYFDLAIMIHVLEHVEHERLILKEMRRVAKRVVIIVPLENHIRVENSIATSGRYGHINFYRPETLLNLMSTTGFILIRSQVVTSSLRYEKFVSGNVKGIIKNTIRNGVLRFSQKAATSLFTYVGGVYCDSASVKV